MLRNLQIQPDLEPFLRDNRYLLFKERAMKDYVNEYVDLGGIVYGQNHKASDSSDDNTPDCEDGQDKVKSQVCWDGVIAEKLPYQPIWGEVVYYPKWSDGLHDASMTLVEAPEGIKAYIYDWTRPYLSRWRRWSEVDVLERITL